MSTDILKLHPEVKQRWLEALRSGKYKQTKDRLRESGGYCCLGVLCDLYDPTRWLENDAYMNGSYVPATKVLQWAFDNYDGQHQAVRYTSKDSDTLATLNDNGVPFEAIAEVIETYL